MKSYIYKTLFGVVDAPPEGGPKTDTVAESNEAEAKISSPDAKVRVNCQDKCIP